MPFLFLPQQDEGNVNNYLTLCKIADILSKVVRLCQIHCTFGVFKIHEMISNLSINSVVSIFGFKESLAFVL